MMVKYFVATIVDGRAVFKVEFEVELLVPGECPVQTNFKGETGWVDLEQIGCVCAVAAVVNK